MVVTTTQPATIATIQVIHKFRIPQNLGADETLSYEELADRCGLAPDDMRRFLHMAMSLRLFTETDDRRVGHSAASAALVTMPGLADFLAFGVDMLMPAGLKMAESLTNFPASQEPSQSAVAIALGSHEDPYAVLNKDPERTKMYTNAMAFATSAPNFAVSHFVDSLNWDDKVCPASIVDVGGGKGDLSKAVLRRYAGIQKATSLDLPIVVAGEDVPGELQDRLVLGGYDFFTEQPIKGADVYMFRNIFHNWPDKYAVKILRNQIPALKPGARLLINEVCLSEPDPASLLKQQAQW